MCASGMNENKGQSASNSQLFGCFLLTRTEYNVEFAMEYNLEYTMELPMIFSLEYTMELPITYSLEYTMEFAMEYNLECTSELPMKYSLECTMEFAKNTTWNTHWRTVRQG